LKGTAVFFFCPPFIPGDNYVLRVSLTDSSEKPVIFEQESPKRVQENSNDLKIKWFDTPIITLWKRVRIHMIVHQESFSYNTLKWQEIKRVYEDAFIIIEKPPPQRVMSILYKEWMGYLEKFVYNRRQQSNWENYKKAKSEIHKDNFSNFSFPQRHEKVVGSEQLTPPLENRVDKDFTAPNLLAKLAHRIIKEKLEKDSSSISWKQFGNLSQGKKIGFCVLICKKPSPLNIVAGRYDGAKLFWVTDKKDITQTFVHELGHALFLEHGATKVDRILHGAPGFGGIIVKSLEGASAGPYFSEHDSEDMVPCVMSYYNSYYDNDGRKLKADTPVDWHFCGVCLLRLRFYDPNQLAVGALSIFRELQYNHRNQSAGNKKPLMIATKHYEEQELLSNELRVKISLKSPITIKEGESKHLFILYPQEKLPNNQGLKCFKDLSYFADPRSQISGNLSRAEWISSRPNVADVEFKDFNGTVFCSFLKAKTIGETVIKFRINISDTLFFMSKPLKVKVRRK
jgi:hypothetical protein